MTTVFNLFGMALAGVQPARSHPPAMRPCGAVPSLLRPFVLSGFDVRGGYHHPPGSEKRPRNTASARCKAIGFPSRFFLVIVLALLAGMACRSCEPQIDFGAECRQAQAEGRAA